MSAKTSTCVKQTCQTDQTEAWTDSKKMEMIRMFYKQKLTFLSLQRFQVISGLQLLPEAGGQTLPVLLVPLQNDICLCGFQGDVL